MRTGAILCSQTTDGIEPLGAFNQPVHRSYSQIRAAVLNELGTPFADYFARPDYDAGGARIGWVAHELGEPRRWIDMSAEEQTRLDPARQRILEGFTRWRQQLDAAPANSARNNLGKLLAQAMCVPGPQYLYFVGEQPVVAFWGFRTIGALDGIDPLRLVPGTMVLARATETVVADGAATVVRRRSRWWWLWWLLGLLLLLFLLLWLFFWWERIPVPYGGWLGLKPPSTPIIYRSGAQGLDVTPPPLVHNNGMDVPTGGVSPGGQAAGIGPGAGTDKLPATVPPSSGGTGPDSSTAPVPPSVPPGPNPPDLANKTPIPPDLPPLPPPSGAGGSAGAPATRGPALALPPDAKPGPAGFMQGVWRSRSGLMVNGRPAEEYYRFDKNGQGDVTLRSKDGQTQCTGPAHANVGADHSLSVSEASSLACSDGGTVAGAVTSCTQGADRASCQGVNESDGSHFGVQMESVDKK
jgi:hypothetical protein